VGYRGNYLGQLDENETKQQVSWVTWSGDGTLLATVEVITPDKNQCGSENKKLKQEIELNCGNLKIIANLIQYSLIKIISMI
jgi:hypothetical protein